MATSYWQFWFNGSKSGWQGGTTRRASRIGRHRNRRLALEPLETRLTPAVLLPGGNAALAFDPSDGILALQGNSAEIAVSGSAVTVSLNGQLHSNNAADPDFDSVLASINAWSLHGIRLTGGGTSDSLILSTVATSNDLTVQSDGNVTLADQLWVSGRLTVQSANLTIVSAVRATNLTLTTAGLLDIESGGSLSAQANGDGGTIAAAANDFVNVGQVRADGSNGGNITISARDYLNAGTVSAQGAVGTGGAIQVGFSASYIDTAAAVTTADGAAVGGWVSIDGGSNGRLFSSGHFDANGASGGAVDLFGKDIALVAATVDATGVAGHGGAVRVGGDYQGDNPDMVNAQTVDVTAATTLNANGTGNGGRVIVWSETGTDFAGSVAAQGGGGGFIEVSSHGQSELHRRSGAGADGTLLLDPKNLIVSAAPAGVFPQYNLVNPASGGAFGTQVLTLSTGNVVVSDPTVNNNMGAVYLFNGMTGALLSTLRGERHRRSSGQWAA